MYINNLYDLNLYQTLYNYKWWNSSNTIFDKEEILLELDFDYEKLFKPVITQLCLTELFQHLISWRFFKQSTFFQRRRTAALSIQLCHWNGKSKQLRNTVFCLSLVNKGDFFLYKSKIEQLRSKLLIDLVKPISKTTKPSTEHVFNTNKL